MYLLLSYLEIWVLFLSSQLCYLSTVSHTYFGYSWSFVPQDKKLSGDPAEWYRNHHNSSLPCDPANGKTEDEQGRGLLVSMD